jgi:hypothetical protein
MYVNEMQVKASKGENTVFNLMPFGDLQAGSPVFMREKWDEYVAEVKAKRNVITVGMGDYTDNFRPTIQGQLRLALAKDHEAGKTVDQMHQKQIREEVYPLLKPVVANSACLGLLGGHHDLTYSDGTNSTQYLCRLLRVPYLGDGEALIRVHLKIATVNLSFDIYATHGQGTGGAVGSNIVKLQKLLAHMDVDIVLRGHSCDKFIFQEPQYYLSHSHPPRLRCRNRIIANTGSFSDGRSEGDSTYIEKANLVPKAVGFVTIHVNVKRDQVVEAGKAVNHGQHLVMGD